MAPLEVAYRCAQTTAAEGLFLEAAEAGMTQRHETVAAWDGTVWN